MKMDWRLIKRSFTSSLDEEDRLVLEAWLDESERHRQLYEEMKRFEAGEFPVGRGGKEAI